MRQHEHLIVQDAAVNALARKFGSAVCNHMNDSEPAHAVGDAEDIVREALRVMKPAQRVKFLKAESVRSVLSNLYTGERVGLPDWIDLEA